MNKLIAVLSAAACLGLTAGCGNAPTPDAAKKQPAVFVEVESAKSEPIVSTITATGTITAKNEVKVIAQTEGKITYLGVEEGDHVKAGEVIVKLDGSVLAAQTKEAEANAEDAKANLDRVTRLFNSKLVSDQEFEAAKTRYKVLKARLDYQKVLLAYTVIKSPISGVITFRGVREGDVAVQRAHLLTVSDPATLVMDINISELEVPKIKVGDPVAVHVDAYPKESFSGKVRRVFPSSDPISRLVKVEVQLVDRESRLFPGLFARAELSTSRKEHATVLSNDAIMTSSSGLTSAFVVVDSVVERRDVTIGIREGNRWEILDGVKPGEKVVLSGQSTLNPGMAVKISRER